MQRTTRIFHHVRATFLSRPLAPLRHASHQARLQPATAPKASARSSPPKSPELHPWDARRPRTWILGVLAVGTSLYVVQLSLSVYRSISNRNIDPAIQSLETQADVSARHGANAADYDGNIGLSEWMMGITSTRRRLANMCKGHVLEVSCGTGRNLEFYDITVPSAGWTNGFLSPKPESWDKPRVRSLTTVDLSPEMVAECKQKWLKLYGGQKAKDKLRTGLMVRFLTASATEELPAAPEGNGKYETIIQTFGLCSTPKPVELLVNTARYLDTSNPDARILLLEHGRSYREWMNKIIDTGAKDHAEKWGCWMNRDIGALVEEAAKQSGLEVVREKRRHLGTTWLFELKATPATLELAQQKARQETVVETAKQPSKTWWPTWPWAK